MHLAEPITTRPDAPLASVNPLARVGAAAILMAYLFFALDGVTAGVVLFGIVLATPMSGISLSALLRRAWPIGVAATLIALVNGALGAPRGPLIAALGPLELHAGTLTDGFGLGLRIVAIALAGVVALAAIDPTAMADALVQELHAPPRFALGALGALRLMPLLAQEWQMVALARRARGVSGGSPIGWLRLQAGRLMTLLVGAIRRSTRLAQAMEARGLGTRPCRTAARPQRMARRDVLLLAGAIVLGASAVALSNWLGTFRPLLG
jgi:energy-coupling factor transport system permease protein